MIKAETKAQSDGKDGIVAKVIEPTDWVNSLACSQKPNSDPWVCLYPKDLNKAIKWRYIKTPTVKEVSHEFAGSKFFSKLDAKSAFWCVALDDKSSYLTTFGTIFGTFRYLVMPYGSIDSQNASQAKMDQIPEGLKGVVSIPDDIVVHRLTEEQHAWKQYKKTHGESSW